MKLLSYVPDVITEKFRGYSHAPPVQSSVALPERTPLACSLVKAGGFLVRLAGISGALAVALGAYGAHVLFKRDDIPEERKEAFDRANHYHCLHTLAILAAPLTRRPALVSEVGSNQQSYNCNFPAGGHPPCSWHNSFLRVLLHLCPDGQRRRQDGCALRGHYAHPCLALHGALGSAKHDTTH